jgi:hypothetical protein
VRAADLDALAALAFDFAAALPGDDAVAFRIDCRHRHVGRRVELRRRAHGIDAVPAREELVDRLQRGRGREADGTRQHEQLPNLLGMPLREFARYHVAEAVADQRDLAAMAAMDRAEELLDSVERRCGRAEIGPETPALHLVAAARKEAPQRRRVPVAAQKRRHDDHRMAVAARRGFERARHHARPRRHEMRRRAEQGVMQRRQLGLFRKRIGKHRSVKG